MIARWRLRRRYRRRDRPSRPARVTRLAVLLGLSVVMVLAMLGRLVQLQVVQGDDFADRAAALGTRTISTPAIRGRILAADGKALVANGSRAVLTLDPTTLADQDDDGAGLLRRVAPLVGRTPEQLLERTRPCGTAGAPRPPVCFSGAPYEPIPIADDVPVERALTLLERPEEFPGLGVVAEPTRTYPALGQLNAAQVLGYLGRTNADDIRRDPTLTARDGLGRAGVEKQYDAALRGTPGRTVVAVDARGLPQRTLQNVAPVPGQDVVTNLDPTVQTAAERALGSAMSSAQAQGNPATAGAMVVLDASDGAVVAMASAPTYDPNVWSGGINSLEYARLTDPASGAPLLNRGTTFATAPASTFKAVSVPAAIAMGNDPDASYDCGPSVRIGDRTFRNFESVAFGQIDMRRALEVSCDTVFYRWAYNAWQQSGGLRAPVTATDPFVDTARSFGLGRRTGIDLPDEAAGRIPDRQWKRQRWLDTRATSCQRARTGYPEETDQARASYLQRIAQENCRSGYVYRAGDAVNFSIGQGDVAVTPLQLAVAYSAVANGGTLWAPQVAAATQRPGGGARQDLAPRRMGTVDFPGDSLAVDREGMAAVTRTGTAAAAFRGFPLDSYGVSGKTGTAEIFGKEATSWFASYGPRTASGKQYVVVAMITESGTGATYAAPAARKVWDALRTR